MNRGGRKTDPRRASDGPGQTMAAHAAQSVTSLPDRKPSAPRKAAASSSYQFESELSARLAALH